MATGPRSTATPETSAIRTSERNDRNAQTISGMPILWSSPLLAGAYFAMNQSTRVREPQAKIWTPDRQGRHSASLIYLAPMTNLYDHDHALPVVYLIDHAPGALPNPVALLRG